ncbi:P-loop containing nucleoside triphosphate hydrolase protein [Meredithblackwellia eburnea MCA 4105]
MSTIANPLSPSRIGNNDRDIQPKPPPARKRLVLISDDDFMMDDDALLAEAEMEGQTQEQDIPEGFEEDEMDPRKKQLVSEEELYAQPRPATNASSSTTNATGGEEEGEDSDDDFAEEQVFVRKEVREGKKKLVLVPDEDLGLDMDEVGPASDEEQEVGRQADFTRRTAGRDYTTPDYSKVNFSSRNLNYVPAAPIEATTFDGKKITFKRRIRASSSLYAAKQAKENSAALLRLSKSMLSTPYHTMVNNINKKSEATEKQADGDATNAPMDEDELPELETSLWTDRYRPKKFTDLLGDERVHRSALLWLKEWDQCVFPGTSKTTAAAELKRDRRKKRAREGKFGAGAGGAADEEENTDPWGRPTEKILLLSGPPGLGKTTLAYVLARQAGYQVFEVNASDERAGNVVETRIRPALESRALSMDGGMAGNKPTCVVIDEIDGASGGGDAGFITALVNLITEGSAAKRRGGAGHNSRGKKKREPRPLLRPIICICNDLYAASLRNLRPHARIIRFQPPTTGMVVSRLRTICAEENFRADNKSLTLLTEVAEGDLRSCLNTLQFIKRRSPVLDESAIRATSIGKDMGTSAQNVINNLFKKPIKKKGAPDETKFVDRVVRDVDTCGEFERISTGCFENYLLVKQTNDGWPRILEALDWLFFFERIDSVIRTQQEHSIRPYVPYTFAPWYKLFSSVAPKKIESSKTDYEAYLQGVAHQEIIDSFVHHLPYVVKRHFTATTIASELLPQLNRIISPELKPTNSTVVKTNERKVMLKLVRTMLDMNLVFLQTKTEDGQLTYKLEPPIDVFIHFEGKRATDVGPSRYAVRHMIAQEMQAEELRQEGGATTATAKDIISAYKTKPTASVSAEEVKEKAATDFFGRTIQVKVPEVTISSEIQAPPPKRTKHAVYRFHEGFSNAVRLTKRVVDFC